MEETYYTQHVMIVIVNPQGSLDDNEDFPYRKSGNNNSVQSGKINV